MRFIKLWISVIALFSLTAFGLAGCGGGGGGGGPAPVIVPTAPAAPTGVTAVGGVNQNTLSWSAVSGATSYNIYWSTTPGVSPTNGTKIASVASPYTQLGLSGGTTYHYVVTAVNSAGESAPSPEVSATTITPVASPTNVTVTPGNGQVTLAWTAVPGASSYNIYFTSGDPSVSTTNGTKITSATNPFVHTGLTNGTTYYYIVTAIVGGLESAPTQVQSAVPAVNPAPAAPSVNLRAISSNIGGSQAISISWAPVPGATSYNAYYSDSPGVTKQNGTKVAGVTSTYRPALPLGTNYFVLTAVNANGESTTSPEMALLVPIFTTDLVSGKTITYNDLTTGQLFVFVAQPNGTITYTSNLTGVPASGNGTWAVNNDGTLTLTINGTSLTFGYEVLSITSNGAQVGVTFTKGSAAAVPGSMTIS